MTAGIDWSRVSRVLIVRLRSIGDTVLATPSLIALKRALPNAKVDILLEEWVAPVLDGFDAVDEVVIAGTKASTRLTTLKDIRRRRYDAVFNLHGGTTATFFTGLSGSRFRIGAAYDRYSFLYTHRTPSPVEFWHRSILHSAEQQLAVIGFAGIPVEEELRTRLVVTDQATQSLEKKLIRQTGSSLDTFGAFALIHPAAAFTTKEWAAENFARTIDHLRTKGLKAIAIAADNEKTTLESVSKASVAEVHCFSDLTLPEITALSSKAAIFVGNDSGIAHIASAVNTPSVVVFGSSNRHHWRPWTDAPNEIVFESLPCQPCPGDVCREFGDPKCIKTVGVEAVIDAIERLEKEIERTTRARSNKVEGVLPAV